MKKILFSCAMLAMTAWATNAQETSTYCTPTVTTQGTDTQYCGKLSTVTTTGAKVDANWTNTAGKVNGCVTPINDIFTATTNSTITLKIVSAEANWGVVHAYIDLDGDYAFDASTEKFVSEGTQGNKVEDKSITKEITITAAAGTYLLRIFYVGDQNNNVNDPCGTYTQGGYYDFYFNVVEESVEVTPAPEFATAAGTVFKPKSEASITVTAEEGATIYYTTDGTNPTEETTTTIANGGQISLNTDQPWYSAITVKAMAKSEGKTASAVVETTYYIHDYCMPTMAVQGATATSYVGKLATFTTTGAKTDANWSNPASGIDDNQKVNGHVGLIADAFTAEQGSAVTLNLVSAQANWGLVYAYIDLNGDYTFGDGENFVSEGTHGNGNEEKSINQEVTITAEPGTYLLRVIYVSDQDVAAPCGTYKQGGFYDFAFNVVAKSGTTGLSSAQAAAFRAVASETGLRVSGVPAGETISVYTVNSVLVATATATEGVTELAVPAQGVLLVRAGNQVVKVVK